MRANNLIIAFFAENPPCSSQTCPEMRASEWQYLCAVHDPPKSCCAIDYCCHTLDWATNVLTSPKYFPSRLTLGSEAAGGAQASMRHLTNIFRRVYRIFAHAWFQHRGVFWQVEGHDGLYVFFKTVCDAYALIPEDNYTIPPEAEGHDLTIETPVSTLSPVSIMKNNNVQTSEPNGTDPSTSEAPSQGEATTTISTGATTRRHKHTPSTGTNVTTISESEEDDSRHNDDQVSPEETTIILPAAEIEGKEETGPESDPTGEESLANLDLNKNANETGSSEVESHESTATAATEQDPTEQPIWESSGTTGGEEVVETKTSDQQLSKVTDIENKEDEHKEEKGEVHEKSEETS